MAEDSFNPEAKAWIDNVNLATGMSAGWRLEFLGKRYKPNRKPAANRAPLKIRRFVRGLPWALVHDAIRYLMSQAPYSGIIYNGVKIPGEFRPTSTRWVRDDQERVDGQATGSYTLVQDLIEDGVTDEFSIPSGGSCSEEVVTEWRWDDPEVVDVTTLDGFGEQGVTYSIQAVRRSEEGTFEYAVVRRVAKTQISGWHTTACTEFETTEVATWDNVYGGIGGGSFKSDAETTLDIPEPCEAVDGVTVTLNVSENDDCTFKIVAQKVTASEVSSSKAISKTSTETTEETTTTATDGDIASFPETTGTDGSIVKQFEPNANDGTYESAELKRRPDGKYDLTQKKTTETPDTVTKKTKRKSLRGVTETTITKSTDDDSVEVSNIGDEIDVELTPSGRWNRSETKLSSDPVGDVAYECQKTVFEHKHSVTKNVAALDQDEKGGSITETNNASGGTYKVLTQRQTELGSWDVTEQTVTEQPGVEAQVTKQRKLRATVSKTTTRGVEMPADGAAVSKVGDVETFTKTPGGLWDHESTKVELDDKSQIFQHNHQESMGVETLSVTRTMTSKDTFPDSDALDEVAHGTTLVAQNKTAQTIWNTQEDGTVDKQVILTAYTEVIGKSASRWATETSDTVVVKHDADTDMTTPAGVPTDACFESSSEPNDYGSATTRVTTYTPTAPIIHKFEWNSETKSPSSTLTYANTLIVFKNVKPSDIQTVTGGGSGGTSGEPNAATTLDLKGNANVSVSVNKFGLLDGSITTSELTKWDVSSSGGSSGGNYSADNVKLYQYRTSPQGKPQTRILKVNTETYYGKGNESSEAATAASSIYIPGASIGSRTYITKIVEVPKWSDDDIQPT